jgi:uncharacterized membrane protein
MKIIPAIRMFGASIGFTAALLLFRVFYSGSLVYLFFAWNIFLAVIPLATSILLLRVKNGLIQWLLVAAWLLFLPNAFYIITDMVHLRPRFPVPYWLDIILVFSAAMNGLMLAFASIFQVEIFLRSKFGKYQVSGILVLCLFLSSFGVYMGRFLRWNSWDIISDPMSLCLAITDRIMNPTSHPRTWGMTILFAVFFMIFYQLIKNIIHSIRNETTDR